MRVLVATTAGEGHFGPVAPFARAVQAAGHEVAVAAPESFAPSVRDAGLAHLPVGDVPPEIIGPVMARLPGLSRADANRTVIREVFGRLDVEWALPGMRAAFESWRPDVLVREPCEFASYLVAEETGVPYVGVAISLAAFEGWARGVLADSLTAFGAPADDARLWDGPRVALLPASFEAPGDAGPAPTRRFAPEARDPSPLPDWWPGDERPLVYLSFGSVAASIGFFPDTYRGALDAIADLDVRILVTTGRQGDPAALGRLQPNVRCEQWVPQRDVLARAAAVVSHGGFGTIFGSLAAGVPTVVVPLFARDQFLNSARVTEAGVGVGLSGPDEVGRLGEAVRRVLVDPTVAVTAQTMAEEIAGQAPLASFPDYLAEQLPSSR